MGHKTKDDAMSTQELLSWTTPLDIFAEKKNITQTTPNLSREEMEGYQREQIKNVLPIVAQKTAQLSSELWKLTDDDTFVPMQDLFTILLLCAPDPLGPRTTVLHDIYGVVHDARRHTLSSIRKKLDIRPLKPQKDKEEEYERLTAKVDSIFSRCFVLEKQ